MEDFVVRRRATYRQKPPKPVWRAIPDEAAEQLFSVLRCHRDPLISFWLSSGVRAAELLGLRHGDLDISARTITVVSNGSPAREQVPASVDSFAWLALYLAEDRPPLVEGGPVWWTRTDPARPLTPLASLLEEAGFIRIPAERGLPTSQDHTISAISPETLGAHDADAAALLDGDYYDDALVPGSATWARLPVESRAADVDGDMWRVRSFVRTGVGTAS